MILTRQIILILSASTLNDWSLFFGMLAAMCFVFGQIPITGSILSGYVPDERRWRSLRVKFLLNLYRVASVLPISSFDHAAWLRV